METSNRPELKRINHLQDAMSPAYTLLGSLCVCGMSKNPGASFCGCCLAALTRLARHALNRPAGNGYEAAHAEALKQLRSQGRIR